MKNRSLKKVISLFLTGMLAASVLAGCNNTPGTGSTGSPAQSGSSESGSAAQEYNGNDVSEPVELLQYYTGDAPKDLEVIRTELNKRLKEDINASVTMKNIPLADMATKYSLTIGSGEPIDLIMSGTGTYYAQEASKGAFAEVTEEVLTKYMPLTNKYQAPASLEQAKINGKIYFLPNNSAKVNANTVIIRGDLREKYGLDPLETPEDLKGFYQKVVENEQGSNMFPFAASQKNDLKGILFTQANDYIGIGSSTMGEYYYFKYQSDPVQEDDIIYALEDPAYLEFLKEMKEWSDLGFWSKSAIANNTDPKDTFLAGGAASYTSNLGTCGVVANDIMNNHPEWKPEIYDLTPESAKVKGTYIDGGYAVLASSENKERAFMYLDLIKHDQEYYTLCRYGIEDIYWVDEGPYDGEEYFGYYSTTDKSPDYPFGNPTTWGNKNERFERANKGMFPDQKELGNKWTEEAVENPMAGLTFDETAVINEMSNINNTKVKYMNTLDLGLSEDVEGTLKAFQNEMKTSGIDKVKEELVKQINAYNESR